MAEVQVRQEGEFKMKKPTRPKNLVQEQKIVKVELKDQAPLDKPKEEVKIVERLPFFFKVVVRHWFVWIFVGWGVFLLQIIEQLVYVLRDTAVGKPVLRNIPTKFDVNLAPREREVFQPLQ